MKEYEPSAIKIFFNGVELDNSLDVNNFEVQQKDFTQKINQEFYDWENMSTAPKDGSVIEVMFFTPAKNDTSNDKIVAYKNDLNDEKKGYQIKTTLTFFDGGNWYLKDIIEYENVEIFAWKVKK